MKIAKIYKDEEIEELYMKTPNPSMEIWEWIQKTFPEQYNEIWDELWSKGVIKYGTRAQKQEFAILCESLIW